MLAGRTRIGLVSLGAALMPVPAAFATEALAATVSVDRACYVNNPIYLGQPVTITGSGWPAGDTVEFIANDLFADATVNPDGTVSVTTTGPVLGTIEPVARTFTLTAADQDSPATATTTFQVANLAVDTAPKVANPRRKVKYTFSGFTPGKHIYAHYLHKGKVVARQRFGIAHGPCGLSSGRFRLYPGRQRYQQYQVQFDGSRRYSRRSSPALVATLNRF